MLDSGECEVWEHDKEKGHGSSEKYRGALWGLERLFEPSSL
jgi:hypothetical protein